MKKKVYKRYHDKGFLPKLVLRRNNEEKIVECSYYQKESKFGGWYPKEISEFLSATNFEKVLLGSEKHWNEKATSRLKSVEGKYYKFTTVPLALLFICVNPISICLGIGMGLGSFYFLFQNSVLAFIILLVLGFFFIAFSLLSYTIGAFLIFYFDKKKKKRRKRTC